MLFHVTRIGAGCAVYGHPAEHCDANGCNGDELFLGADDGAARKGGLVEISEDGAVRAVEAE